MDFLKVNIYIITAQIKKTRTLIIPSEAPSHAPSQLLLPPLSKVTVMLTSNTIDQFLPAFELLLNGIISYLVFLFWLLPFDIILMRCFQVIVNNLKKQLLGFHCYIVQHGTDVTRCINIYSMFMYIWVISPVRVFRNNTAMNILTFDEHMYTFCCIHS